MSSSTASIVVSDAHLCETSGSAKAAFHRFLERVPDSGDHLLINGDLFEFWFTYRSVIPRVAFSTLSALERVRQAGVRLSVVGGNHDSWGGSFWTRELDAEYLDGPTEMNLAGWSSWVAHGHGLVELDRTGLLMHRVTGHPLTARAFHLIHPDLAFWMVRQLSRYLAGRRHNEDLVSRAAAAQAEFARQVLRDRENIDLVVLGHTHRPALVPHGVRRWYLNPGAWIEGSCYAIVNRDGPELRSFSE